MTKQSPTLVSNSGTTTSQKAHQSKTLAPSGGPGLPTISTGTAPDLGRALTQAEPKATLEIVRVLLPSEISSALKPVYNHAGTLTRYGMTQFASRQSVARAREILAQSLTPISLEEAIDLTTELRLLTRPSPGSEMDQLAQAKIYINKLLDYPADVVRHVLRAQPEFSPWWPAWAELKERLEINSYRRRMMFEALTP